MDGAAGCRITSDILVALRRNGLNNLANMGHCRFQNTLRDLRDCYEALADMDSLDNISPDEKDAALLLFRLCVKMADLRVDYDPDCEENQ